MDYLAQIKSVLRTQHGGPGPHASGSSQEVHGSWNPNRISNAPGDFLVKIELEKVPDVHMDGLERIDFTESGFIRTISAATGELSEAYGIYNPGERRIKLAMNADNVSVFGGETAIHEIGHHVHLSRLSSEGALAWAKISRRGQAASISAYARTNQGEHFAEAYRAYFRGGSHRKKLKALEPASYKFMRNINKQLLPVGQYSSDVWEERYNG